MAIEYRRDPNLWGEIKGIVARYPSVYREARRFRNNLLDRIKFPYVVEKVVAGIRYKMIVGSGQEEGVVAGLYFEEELLAEMMGIVERGDVVWDIGAATGTHAIPLAIRAGPGGVVYAFEPDGECAKALAENINLNNLHNVTVVQTGLWHENGILFLHTGGRREQAPWITAERRSSAQGFRQHLPIPVRSMESLVRDDVGMVRPPDVVKIDVEGAAEEVLGGMGDLRPKHIFVEVHPKMGEDCDRIASLLGALGYKKVTERPREQELHLHFALNQN